MRMFTVLERNHTHLQVNVIFNKRQILMNGTRKLPSPLGVPGKQSFPAKVLGEDLEGIYPFQVVFQD